MPAFLEPGQVLRERYIIREIIGHGGMGSIYLAEDNRLHGRLCAAKQFVHDADLPEILRSQVREQFYREASVLARLDHPNLPKVSDYFSIADCDYIIMDFVPGDDLKTLMDQSRRRGRFLNQSDVIEWAIQLTDALEYLHNQDKPVIHRDIKPSNLKLTPRGLLKLVDFGLVKQMMPDEMTITVIQGRGTAYYTPLEQYGGDDGHTDPRSDVFAFGSTLYHLLTNHPPVEAKRRFLSPDSLPKPRTYNPNIDQHVEDTILWAMSLHPNERPQSISEFRSALLGERAAPITRHPDETRSRYVRKVLPTLKDRTMALIAAVLLLTAIIATWV